MCLLCCTTRTRCCSVWGLGFGVQELLSHSLARARALSLSPFLSLAPCPPPFSLSRLLGVPERDGALFAVVDRHQQRRRAIEARAPHLPGTVHRRPVGIEREHGLRRTELCVTHLQSLGLRV
jgi:hypothetical protein